ncbi:MAG: hypothetical protein IKD31_01535 [Clostridia bacterium]|nr:hypothetical protein [Clostridia bacterium]
MNAFDRYLVESTHDKKDRTEEIEALLLQNKAVLLGSGAFYVRGIRMPEGSTLAGLGDCTELILSEEVESGCTVTMANRCTVKDLTLKDSDKEEFSRPETLGTRHGIGFIGNAVSTKDSDFQPKDGIVDGCRMYGFSGGGLFCLDSGYATDSSLCVNNCRMRFCGAGIYISHFSEYHKFSNVHCNKNLYGCINNGGNNVFAGCSFDANTLGFLIDNSEGQSRNNAHGSCVGCTFNHTDHNQGIGIKILNSAPGYVFSACQMYYSKIVVENSQGIQIANFNFGRGEEFYVKGGGVVRFSDCLFSAKPQFFVEDNSHVLVDGCYTKGGAAVSFPEKIDDTAAP